MGGQEDLCWAEICPTSENWRRSGKFLPGLDLPDPCPEVDSQPPGSAFDAFPTSAKPPGGKSAARPPRRLPAAHPTPDLREAPERENCRPTSDKKRRSGKSLPPRIRRCLPEWFLVITCTIWHRLQFRGRDSAWFFSTHLLFFHAQGRIWEPGVRFWSLQANILARGPFETKKWVPKKMVLRWNDFRMRP